MNVVGSGLQDEVLPELDWCKPNDSGLNTRSGSDNVKSGPDSVESASGPASSVIGPG